MPCATSESIKEFSSGNCDRNPENAGSWAWAYRRMFVFDCLVLKDRGAANPSYASNVTCCTTDGCNVPIPGEDEVTELALNEPLQPTGYESSAVGQRILDDMLTCYQNMALGEMISEEVPPAVQPIKYYAMTNLQYDGTVQPTVCYAAKKDVCKSDANDCSPEELLSGRWVWEYGYMSLYECYEQRWNVSTGVLSADWNVTCCASDLCNRPDAMNDAITQVKFKQQRLITSQTQSTSV